MKPAIRLFIFILTLVSPQILFSQWSKTNGLPGGDINGFLQMGDTVLVGAGEEIYFSVNQGLTWTPLPVAGNYSLSRSCTDGRNIAVTDNSANATSKLVFSDDFGQNWNPINKPDSLNIYECWMADNYLYIDGSLGVHRTNDLGNTWQPVYPNYLEEVAFDGQRLTGFASPNLIRSTDGGITWDTLLQIQGYNVSNLLQHDNDLFVFIYDYGVYCSSDNGQTWQLKTNLPDNYFSNVLWHNDVIYGVSSEKVMYSDDKGSTWMPIDLDNYIIPINGISIGNVILIGGYNHTNGKNLFRSSDNGQSWFAATSGLLTNSGKLRSQEGYLRAIGDLGVYKLDADGVNWTQENYSLTPTYPSIPYFTDFLVSGNNQLICASGQPFVSLDGGTSWVTSFLSQNFLNSNVLSLEFAGGKVVGIANFFSGMDLFVSHNNGLTFQPMMYPPGIHDKIAVDAGVIYIYQTSGIFASSDAGNSWLQIGTPAPIDPNPNWTSWGDFIVSDDVFMLFSGLFGEKMSISRDRGQTWSFIDLKTAGLPFGDKPLNGLSRVGNYLITASRYGIFLSQDNGLTWTAWNEGLTSRKVQYIAVHNGYLFASTQGGGIWKRSLSELGMQTVSGKVYFDANNNQTLDAGEPLQSGVIVKSLTSGTYGQTRSNGTYELLSNLAQEDITAVPPKNYWAVTPPSVTTGVPGTGIDFALSLNPDARDVSVRVVNAAPLRPGFVTRYFLDWKNDVPMPAENVEVTLEYPMDMLDVADVSQQPVSQAPGKLVWQPGAVSADASGSFWIDFLTLSSIPLGTEVCLHASITALGNDIAPADNIYIRCDNVVGAFDPNDKQAEPAGYLTLNQLADKTPVVYTVRFQNTGNYPATIVRILDSLQTGFDPGTFRVLASSHPYTWSMRGLGIIEFSFNNIQLPPQSLDEPGSHGFIQYSVAPVEQLPLGMPLRNTAHIFFDYNAPVSTNTTSTLAGLVNTVEHVASSLVMTVMPNPACSLVRFEVNDSNGQFFVYNSHGQLVLQQPNTTGSVVMGVEYLPSGAYRVAYQAENGNIITVALIIP